MYRYRITKTTYNDKTGPMVATYSDKKSCPLSCPLRGFGCYGYNFPLNHIWDKVAREGMNFVQFISGLNSIRKSRAIRHFVTGDFPGDGKILDLEKCLKIAESTKKNVTISYTHYDIKEAENRTVIDEIEKRGLLVFASCNTLEEAKEAKDLGVKRVTCILPEYKRERGLCLCPNQLEKSIQCIDCLLCARDTKAIVGFVAHGTKRGDAREISTRKRK